MSRSPGGPGAETAGGDYVAGWQATLRLLRGGKSWSGREPDCAFLNLGSEDGPRLADASAALGLDLRDDGRGLAVVDWDGDGDLDLWLANRTGPRLRLMVNRGAPGNVWVALRLRGTVSNRDAVGARATVEVAGAPPLVRTLYAGDGFLSQSSKWLHFGLGREREIAGVSVRWPGGKTETFTGVEAGHRYLLVEGRGEAAAVARRGAVELEPAVQEPPPAASAARVFLPVRLPLPRLPHARFDGSQASAAGPGPLLVNFWATWCLPCLAELKELTARREELRAAGLDVLALSVDGLAEDRTTGPADARQFLADAGFPFDSGLATAQLLDKVELLLDALFDRREPFAVPASLLIDRSGRLAALYRGPVDPDDLLRDVARLDASPEGLHAASAPLPGRWIARLPDADLLWMAKTFQRYPQDAGLFLERALERDPESAETHRALAGLLASAGEREDAIRHYRRAVAIEPGDAEAHRGLGVALRAAGRPGEARRHLAEAARLRPEWSAPLIPLAWILISAPDAGAEEAGEAVRLAERALELAGERHPVALDTLAAAYAAAGRPAEAVAAAREAVARARELGQETLALQIERRSRRYGGDPD